MFHMLCALQYLRIGSFLWRFRQDSLVWHFVGRFLMKFVIV